MDLEQIYNKYNFTSYKEGEDIPPIEKEYVEFANENNCWLYGGRVYSPFMVGKFVQTHAHDKSWLIFNSQHELFGDCIRSYLKLFNS